MNTPSRISIAQSRSRMITALRDFFLTRKYLETETPILSPFRIPESYISPFKTEYENPFSGAKSLTLIPSPEIWMKRLIAEGFPSCFQITKSFRNAEQLGAHHNPEFTMLEWYTLDAGYFDSMSLTKEMLAFLTDVFIGMGSNSLDLKSPREISMIRLVKEKTGIDLEKCTTKDELEHSAARRGMQLSGDTWEEVFNKLFLLHVEPHLTDYPVVFIYDYPMQISCLAKIKNGTSWRERWELYIGGIEIANCYTEETDSEKVREFIEGEITVGTGSNVDWEMTEVSGRMLPCSGVALGVDRLLMAFTGIRDIREVILFPFVDF